MKLYKNYTIKYLCKEWVRVNVKFGTFAEGERLPKSYKCEQGWRRAQILVILVECSLEDLESLLGRTY